MATSIQIVFDTADPDREATFWAAALGYQLQPPPPGFETWAAFLRAQDIPEASWNDRSAIVDPEAVGTSTSRSGNDWSTPKSRG